VPTTLPGTEPELTADCSRCFALCCVLLPYSRTAGFGADKPGGVPCPQLAADDRCTIHADLRERGWPGCTVFDCFGAGQQVAQVTYGGTSWREHDDLGEMAAVLSVMRRVHEMLAHLREVARRTPDPAAEAAWDRLLVVRDLTPVELLTLDLDDLQGEVGDVLAAASARVRGAGPDLRRADLAGADLRRRDLRDAALRGATLIAADLRCVRLGRADLLGADLRDADLRGADLGEALFLTQPQVDAARGDTTTRLPESLHHPGHWA
jgi:pentapeptide repeat protein